MLSSVRSTAASGTWFLSRVRAGNAHTNGMESHWAMFKRAGSPGVYHHVSVKHLPRYTTEFEGRDNRRPMNTAEQMGRMAREADGKLLTYATLIS